MPCVRRFPAPGGMRLVKRLLELCGFPSGAVLADIGCGTGECVRYINESHGFKITGIDKDTTALTATAGNACLPGDARDLPFASGSLDGVLFICSFSKMEDPDKVLLEACRVLKWRGRIALADFYARGREGNFSGALGRIEFRRSIAMRLSKAGFGLCRFEDHTHEMRESWGQIIFDCGKDALDAVMADYDRILTAQCGYGLFISEKVV